MQPADICGHHSIYLTDYSESTEPLAVTASDTVTGDTLVPVETVIQC